MGEQDAVWRPTLPWIADRARSRLERIRRDGFSRVAGDDFARGKALIRRYRWGVQHDSRPNAMPVFIVGIQRSGTDMLIRAFKECPEAEVHNEAADTRAFNAFALRSDRVIRQLVESSRHRAVVFKSLLDSHRIVHLMTRLGAPTEGRSIWIYRSLEGRVRSTMALWPENNRRVLRAIAAGRASEHWEAAGLSDTQLELVRSFDYDELSAESAAALLWYLRNSLFFEHELSTRPDVALVSYERILEDPERFVQLLCGFLGLTYHPRMIQSIAPRRPATQGAMEVDDRVRLLCGQLYERLENELDSRIEQGSLSARR